MIIEGTIRDYLEDQLDVPVYMEKPPTVEDSYVIVEKTGGSENNCIMNATIAIQSIASSMYEASVLNEQVKKAMRGITALDNVSAARLNSDTNWTNTTTKEYRYQATYLITYLGMEV